LYKFARKPECAVEDCWEDDGWYIDFRRALSVREVARWEQIHGELTSVTLVLRGADVVLWALEKNQFFYQILI
jgi:hypothetical protein